ncbi:MAG TPA: sulfatase-like hydrolase/transferase [Solirubrobacteraceae bacterium]|jgi:arylsulfatase
MSDQTVDRTKLPIRRPPFTGVANQTLGGSQPGWEQIGHVQPPEGAPNVLVVLIDDAGFGNPSTFGGPINTPNYDRIADEGLRYNRFHVTAMCSPTRAALLTGRNHHAVGMGGIPEFSGGFPGYSAMLPKDAAPFPKILKENGYSTAAVGKWHLTPEKEQGPAGPFDHWPNAWGFDYYWGFLAPEAGQYDTMIAENQKFIGVQEGKDGKPFYFPEAMTDQAIDWLHGVRGHDATKPWCLYYSTGCSHAPHHVAKEWSQKYEGQFDQGWDRLREETFERQKKLGVVPADAVLTPRDELMPAWDSLDETSKRLFARQMEVYAGYSENADHHVGRLLDSIEEMGELDNTIVIWIWGDNGASLEGTPTGTFNEGTMVNGLPLTDQEQMQLTLKWGGLEAWGTEMMYPHYSTAWAWAGNTPFAWGKQVASHLGGTRNPLVIRCPQRIHDRGNLRSQFTHVTDIGPTILDMVGIPEPTHVDGVEQQPMTGVSFAGSIADPDAAERHTQQYFENFGNRAIYKDGWWLAMRMPRVPWRLDPELLKRFAPGVWKPDEDPVELYYLPDDFSQANDLAASNPDKVKELQALFWEEAEKYNVKPLLAGFSPFFGILPPLGANTTVTYHGDVQNVAPGLVPRVYNHSYTISADLHIPDGGAEGVIVADASHLGGFSLFVQDGKLKHTYAFLGVFEYHQESAGQLPTGDVNVELTFAADEAKPATPGEITLFVNGDPVGSGRLDHTVPFGFSGYAGMDVGRDNGLVVDRSYADKAPFAFTGTVKKVVFDVAPHLGDGDEQALHEHASQADTVRGIRA